MNQPLVCVFVCCSEDGASVAGASVADARVAAARFPTLKKAVDVAKELKMIVFLDMKDTKVGPYMYIPFPCLTLLCTSMAWYMVSYNSA